MGFADELRGTKSKEKEYIQAFTDEFYDFIKKECIKAAERGKNFLYTSSVKYIEYAHDGTMKPRILVESYDFVGTCGDRLMKVQDCLEPKLRKEGFKKVTFEMEDFFRGKCLAIEIYW